MSKTYNVGDQVKILEAGRDYFGPMYTGTFAKIVQLFPSQSFINGILFDGRIASTPECFLEEAAYVNTPIYRLLEGNDEDDDS